MKKRISKSTSIRKNWLFAYSSEMAESEVPTRSSSDLTMGPSGNPLQVAPDFPDTVSVPRMPIDSTHVTAVNNVLSVATIAGSFAFAGGPSSPVSVPTASGATAAGAVVSECVKCHIGLEEE
jgi:hypothetical protein